MGHRHVLNTPQIFESDNDHEWNHMEQPYMHIGRTGVSEGSSHLHPGENMTNQGGHFSSQWTPVPRSNGYSSSMPNVETPHYQPQAPGPSRDPFLHQSASGSFHIPDNYGHHAFSSSVGGHTVHGVDGGFHDPTVSNGRGQYKRKSPGMPPICERGTTSRYYNVGSSSDVSLPSDPWQEKQNVESYHTPWEYPPSYRGHSLSIGGEGTLRNVRSRSAVDLEANIAGNRLSSNPSNHPFINRSSDHTSSVDFWGQSSNASAREWSQNFVAPASHGTTFTSDASFLGHDPNPPNPVTSHPGASLETGGYHNDIAPNRNLFPQISHGSLSLPVRGVRSGYGQRTAPTFRASSSTVHPGHVAASDEGVQVAGESYHPRPPRPLSAARLRNIDRSGRNLISSDRYRSFAEEASLRDRLTAEALMVVDRSAIYGSRSLFDQHRDMRLDVDNMSYEELLALGERIGHVNTGLSDASVSKCLTESIYCSSDQLLEEGTCVICLEEYKNMDDVGTLKVCGHDFHVGCIRKWLSIKNLCPICKATALDDSMKEK